MEKIDSNNGELKHLTQEGVGFPSLKVSCPKCFQSYRINTSEIHQSRPKFACTKCDFKFWIPFPESLKQKELIGFPLSWIESAPESESALNIGAQISAKVEKTSLPSSFECPSCGFESAKDEAECKKCGIIFERLLAKIKDKDEGVQSTPTLRKHWHKILQDFENDDLHESFILDCQKLNCMNFALHRYTKLEEAVGSDQIIERMKNRLKVLSEQKLAKWAQEPKLKNNKTFRRPTWLNLTNFMVFCSAVVIVVGFMVPGGRNLIGVGAALGFLSLAARWTFR